MQQTLRASLHHYLDPIIGALTLAAVNLVTCLILPDHVLKDKQQNNVDDEVLGIMLPQAARPELHRRAPSEV